MRTEDWMTRDVRTCTPDTSLNDAAGAMWDRDCGILPVVDADGVAIGIITDRDICMGAYLTGRSLKDLRVGDSMARRLFGCAPSDPIEQVIRVMGDHRVRRVPVLDGRGRPVGVISFDDLSRRLVTLQDEKLRARLVPRMLEALASISESAEGRAVPETVPARPSARSPVLAG